MGKQISGSANGERPAKPAFAGESGAHRRRKRQKARTRRAKAFARLSAAQDWIFNQRAVYGVTAQGAGRDRAEAGSVEVSEVERRSISPSAPGLWMDTGIRGQTAARRPVMSSMTSTTSAITSTRWIRLPATWNPQPKSHSSTRMAKMVQSMQSPKLGERQLSDHWMPQGWSELTWSSSSIVCRFAPNRRTLSWVANRVNAPETAGSARGRPPTPTRAKPARAGGPGLALNLCRFAPTRQPLSRPLTPKEQQLSSLSNKNFPLTL